MKITMILLTCLLLQVRAAGYAQRVSMNRQQCSIHSVLEEIRKQTHYDFLYDMSLFNSAKPVSIKVNAATVEQVLDACFKGTPYTYIIKKNVVVITASDKADISDQESKPAVAVHLPQQQVGRVAGKVIDERGGALPGAGIKVLKEDKTIQSSVDGSYSLSLAPGTYTFEVSYVSYQTKRITDVIVRSGQLTPLDIVLNSSTNTLNQVMVTGSYKKESIAALYTRQKNEAGISNGISAEQISTLPDKNVGETLKRISGISTTDNRRVVIRGIAERYNLAMMDGATLPSTDVQVRDFEFDIIPSNLIDNVVVSKTSTPDMSFGFGGGLVQISTLAVPDNNFTTFSFGSKYIDGSTGKDFLGYGRGKNDYLGFDDGSRNHFPKELLIFNQRNYEPTKPDAIPAAGEVRITPAMIAEQNRRIGGLERMGTRTYKALPGQNYQFSLGRSYQLAHSRLGFVGSLSYRNEQSNDNISHFGRGVWEKLGNTRYDTETGAEIDPTFANQYNFNTSWGALFNLGWNSKNHKITARNFYSRVFNNQFSRIVGFGNDIGFGKDLPAIREFDRPKFIDLFQTRINGEHTFGDFRFDWNVSRNKLTNLEKDAVEAWLAPTKTLNGSVYNVLPSAFNNPGGGTFNRAQYLYKETNKIAEAALSYGFKVLGQKQTFKSGYQFLRREGTYDWTLLPISTVGQGGIYAFVPVQQWGQFLEFNDPLKDLFYYPASFSQNGYQGRNTNQAVFGMMDTHFANWIRLVWGLRAEYYKYERLKNGVNDLAVTELIRQGEQLRFVDPETGRIVGPYADPENDEKTWRYLPSASLTLSPLKDLNVRAAYSQSVVRPALIENSRMVRQDPAIGAFRRNEGVLSTTIDHYDLRLEWYPKPGEVISVGYFHKYFDKPVELYRTQLDASMRVYVNTQNSEWAKVNGWELDLRKSLGFIKQNWRFLDDIYLSGNLTLQSSEVQASTFEGKSMANDKYEKSYEYRTKLLLKEKRPLYGQVPVLYNLGIQYDGNRLGANVAFNHMGYKTFTTGLTPDIVEYERPRNQLDAQLSYRFLKSKKLHAKLNMSNLMNNPYRFYINSNDTYKLLDKWKGMSMSVISATGVSDWADIYEWKSGFSKKYDDGYYETSEDGKTRTRVGDKDTFTRKVGAAFSMSVSYSF
ncbi:TonB-dependent receptor [Pedobacter sp. BAL39]|nr:TonB-dependent receptor [Pedobacter sp. BAL39]